MAFARSGRMNLLSMLIATFISGIGLVALIIAIYSPKDYIEWIFDKRDEDITNDR